MTFNETYLTARKHVRVTHTKRGEWHAYHNGMKVMGVGSGRESATRRCAMVVAKLLTEKQSGHQKGRR